jgi:hypothetical protein
LTLVVTGLLLAGFGRQAWIPGLVMGGAATGIELVAARWLVRGLASTTRDTMQGFVAGMLFRLLGIGLFAGLVLWNREVFAPLPTALGFLGVLIPLLFLETRFIR